MKILLLLLECHNIIGRYYCNDSLNHSSRLNLLNHVLTAIQREENDYDLLVTPHNFLLFINPRLPQLPSRVQITNFLQANVATLLNSFISYKLPLILGVDLALSPKNLIKGKLKKELVVFSTHTEVLMH